jgi:hypothetical protein
MFVAKVAPPVKRVPGCFFEFGGQVGIDLAGLLDTPGYLDSREPIGSTFLEETRSQGTASLDVHQLLLEILVRGRHHFLPWASSLIKTSMSCRAGAGLDLRFRLSDTIPLGTRRVSEPASLDVW